MAGKGLKDVTALNKCSACGNVKRAHLLCPYCVKGKLCDDSWKPISKLCSEIQTSLFKKLNPDFGRSKAPGRPHTPTGKATKTESKEVEVASDVATRASKTPEDG